MPGAPVTASTLIEMTSFELFMANVESDPRFLIELTRRVLKKE
jgi:hypothetical protein